MPPDENNLDVKDQPAEDSSPSADAIDDSSPSTKAGEADANANQSMSDFLSKELKVDKGSSDSSSKEDATAEAAESDSKLESDKEKKTEDKEAEGESEDEKEESEDVADGEAEQKPVPYERFQEVTKERETFKQNFEQVLPEVKNYRNITTFCQQHSITPEQFDKVMELQALLNVDPPKALERLLPIVESLQGFVGNKLPADLQAKVDNGKMELDDAKEIATLRARSQFGQRKSEHDREAWQAQQQKRTQAELVEAAQTWEQRKRKSDPDYKPKAKESEPDSLWEMTRDKYLAMLNQLDERGQYVNVVRSAREMSELMEKAYTATKAVFGRFSGRKPATRKSLMSNGSSTVSTKKTPEQAETMAEAIQIGLAQRR